MQSDRAASDAVHGREHAPRLAVGHAWWIVVGTLVAVSTGRMAVGLGGWRGIATGVIVGGVCVGAGRSAGCSWSELGLARRDAGAGLRWGLVVLAAVATVVAIAVIVPATRSFFEDDRAATSTSAWLWHVAALTPLSVVLPEELAFRSTLLALDTRRIGAGRATLVSSFLFGLWHVPTTIGTADGNATTGEVADSAAGLALTTVAMVLAMTAAGWVFVWLRNRSGSVLAPVLAHLATNGAAITATWIVMRNDLLS
jgi:uncharacterized protein